MDIKREYFSDNSIAMDLFLTLAGEKLGTGSMRTVYQSKLNTDHVLKFEHSAGTFANVTEWDVWCAVRHIGDRKLESWFAPCIGISGCGHILWQKFIPNIPPEKLPTRVPECFADLKCENWGLWKGRPVCRDYGNNAVHRHGLSSRLVKANWV